MNVVIRTAVPADSTAIARICNYYIRETVITFEEEEVSSEIIADRIQATIDASLPWLVAGLWE